MSAHQMICHLSDSLRAALSEKYISPSTSLFKRAILKPLALWVPVPWPHDFKTRPEMDQQQGGMPPMDFASDLEELRILFERFCTQEGEFAPHTMFGQMSRAERMRYAYLHFDQIFSVCAGSSGIATQVTPLTLHKIKKRHGSCSKYDN